MLVKGRNCIANTSKIKIKWMTSANAFRFICMNTIETMIPNGKLNKTKWLK